MSMDVCMDGVCLIYSINKRTTNNANTHTLQIQKYYLNCVGNITFQMRKKRTKYSSGHQNKGKNITFLMVDGMKKKKTNKPFSFPRERISLFL